MKVILNKDLAPLGEEGDVKDVAKGYARNFLFPRGIALPYNEKTIKIFEGRKEEIETRKIQKRGSAVELKEKLESLEIEISMPAGPNGKLYGAVTSQTVADELAKLGYQIERKRIELPLVSIKNVGKYKVTVKLYENASAELSVNVRGQEIKTEARKAPPLRQARRRREEQAPVQRDEEPGQSANENPKIEDSPKNEDSPQKEALPPDAASLPEAVPLDDSPAQG